jgi:hypothetical protein
MTTPALARCHVELPRTIPNLEQVAELLDSDKYQELQMAVHRLKEHRLGLQIIARLIAYVERHPLLDLANPKHQRLLVRLWRSRLSFLDSADEWDAYLSTVEALRRRPELQESIGPTAIEEATYKNYQRILTQGSPDRGLRFFLEDLMTRAQHAEAAFSGPYGERVLRLPQQSRHMLESFDLRDRFLVVKRKVALRDSGRRVDYLRHKQSWDLTDAEYAERLEWLRVWKVYCERCRAATARAARVADPLH